MSTKSNMNDAIEALRIKVREFPKDTPAICHDVIHAFLDICLGYQGWVRQLQDEVVRLDAERQKHEKIIEAQNKTIKKFFERPKTRILMPDGAA